MAEWKYEKTEITNQNIGQMVRSLTRVTTSQILIGLKCVALRWL